MTNHLFYITASYTVTLGAAATLGLRCIWRLHRVRVRLRRTREGI